MTDTHAPSTLTEFAAKLASEQRTLSKIEREALAEAMALDSAARAPTLTLPEGPSDADLANLCQALGEDERLTDGQSRGLRRAAKRLASLPDILEERESIKARHDIFVAVAANEATQARNEIVNLRARIAELYEALEAIKTWHDFDDRGLPHHIEVRLDAALTKAKAGGDNENP
jgi:hypothetical protein